MTDPNPTLDQLVSDLALARDRLGAAIQQSAKLELDIDTLVEKEFGERLNETQYNELDASGAIDQAEYAYKSAALVHFSKHGNKHPHSAITIRQSTKLNYDPEQARQYCITHLPAALSLKKSAFETVAKVTKPGFVELGTVFSVSIKTDLSAWLPTEQEGNTSDE